MKKKSAHLVLIAALAAELVFGAPSSAKKNRVHIPGLKVEVSSNISSFEKKFERQVSERLAKARVVIPEGFTLRVAIEYFVPRFRVGGPAGELLAAQGYDVGGQPTVTITVEVLRDREILASRGEKFPNQPGSSACGPTAGDLCRIVSGPGGDFAAEAALDLLIEVAGR